MAVARTDRSFEELYDRHREALAKYCRALVRDEHDARDVLQNVAVRVLVALRRGDNPERERAWLYRIARNEAITLFRSQRHADQLDEATIDPGADPPQTIVARERLTELASDIHALTPQARQILLMSSVGGLARQQIAAELGLTPGAVSQSLSETHAGLRVDRGAHELPCAAVRAALNGPDGRRRRTRTVRAHLRGCAGCREWARRHRKRARLEAILPAPIASMLRWVQPWVGGDPGTAALTLRTPAAGACRALGLIVSLAVASGGPVPNDHTHRRLPATAAASQPRAQARSVGRGGVTVTLTRYAARQALPATAVAPRSQLVARTLTARPAARSVQTRSRVPVGEPHQASTAVAAPNASWGGAPAGGDTQARATGASEPATTGADQPGMTMGINGRRQGSGPAGPAAAAGSVPSPWSSPGAHPDGGGATG